MGDRRPNLNNLPRAVADDLQGDIDLALVRQFTDFLDTDDYQERLQLMMRKRETRFVVNINDIKQDDLRKRIIFRPMEALPAFDQALRDTMLRIAPGYGRDLDNELHVGVDGSLGAHMLNPRLLSARFLGSLVSVEGIITKVSLVRPKVIKSVHFCEATGAFHKREYRDATTPGAFMPTSSVYPTKDAEGNLLVTEYGLCEYQDHQSATVQEMPEKAPAGLLPRSIDVVLDGDLVDKVKPGDRVCMYGTYRALPNKTASSTSGIFRTVLIVNHIRHLSNEATQPQITASDILKIKELAQQRDIFQLLSQSLAPSIYGHENIKQALLLQLLGGMEKRLLNGTHLRGDINILMVGDPSTAKSQLLRFVLNTAPLAVATTGRGASGVGLTAAVTVDNDTGERRLEAGAMVLADRGIVCIDEFDKMSDADRVAIHEVMEQQTVTIAKAGIHTSLNARCSVLAAANPVYGQYNRERSPTENIGLPDSILSRFDLLFIVLDHMNSVFDRRISEHVIRMHQYRRPGEDEGAPVQETSDAVQEEERREDESAVFVSDVAGGAAGALVASRRNRQRLLTIPFLRKYIHYAKQLVKPVLTPEASAIITDAYADLRSNNVDAKALPTTPRTLETLIRLATAHAKARLVYHIEAEDAEFAVKILQGALFDANSQQQRHRRRTAGQGGDVRGGRDDGGDSSDDSWDEDGPRSPRKRRTRAASSSPRKRAAAADTAADGADASSQRDDADAATRSPRRSTRRAAAEAAIAGAEAAQRARAAPSAAAVIDESAMDVDQQGGDAGSAAPAAARPTVSPERASAFLAALQRLFRQERSDVYVLSQAVTNINRALSEKYTREEAEVILAPLEAENKVMVRDGIIFRI